MADEVKVYTVNGAASGSASSLPDWLTRKRAAANGKGKRRIVKEQIEGTIDLIQHFEFPEASIKIKTTRDGHHAIATGVYKPQMRVFDLDELTLKFERHSDSENIDFIILSDDWTKTMHLQNDRTLELHTQGGLHYKTRIPKFGRALAYHYPSCDSLISATGHEVYRLNLDQGRFLNPLTLDADTVQGVNCIDVNPVHQLLSFGTEGFAGSSSGVVDFWDPRSRSRVGTLRLPWSQLENAPGASLAESSAITSISSRSDGLSLAVGTSTGHTLLYDMRSPRAYAVKDQGYGLPVKALSWVEGGSKMAGDGIVVSADKKVVKLWDRNTPDVNFASITPATDINHVHHIPGSGFLMMANEGIQMTSYYIPQLGPAPKWCSFLDNITEEMEDQTVRNVYDDFKFIERSEISSLGLDHLIGTPALKPYMHGYFVSLKLYDAARVIANPFAYAEHREKVVQEKLAKLANSRIRTKKGSLPKVNKALAEKIMRAEDKEEKKKAKARARKGEDGEDVEMEQPPTEKKSVLNDPRFAELFENPEFQVDETSREFALLNPATAGPSSTKQKTAVEEEEEESDRPSSDGLGGESSSEEDGSDASADSSDEGELVSYNPRARQKGQEDRIRAEPQRTSASSNARNSIPTPRRPNATPRMVAARASTSNGGEGSSGRAQDRSAAFGERQQRSRANGPGGFSSSSRGGLGSQDRFKRLAGGGAEVSWVPSEAGGRGDDSLFDDGRGQGPSQKAQDRKKEAGVEKFGAGMEKGRWKEVDAGDRTGRTQRRSNIRSGSKNAFRSM